MELNEIKKDWEIISIYQYGFPELPMYKKGDKWVCSIHGTYPGNINEEEIGSDLFHVHSIKTDKGDTYKLDDIVGGNRITGFNIDKNKITIVCQPSS